MMKDVGETSRDSSSGGGDTKKLSISVFANYYDLERVIERFNKIHPDVEITLNQYDMNSQKYKDQVGTQLMSGLGDDIIEAVHFLDIGTSESGCFTDLLPLMEQDPSFNKEDYYFNVFEGMFDNGKLFYFPTYFYYSFVGVNNRVSEELTTRFQQYNQITYREVLDLYNHIEDKGGRSLNGCMDAFRVMIDNFNSFVDLEKRECYFDTPEFIALITDAKNATEPGKAEKGELGYNPIFSYVPKWQIEEYALKYTFLSVLSNGYQFLLPYREQEVFTHFVPLVNEEGKVLMLPSKYFCINAASENKEIAWEFIKFLTTPEANEGSIVRNFPVNKGFFRSFIAEKMREDISSLIGNDGFAIDTDGIGGNDRLVEKTLDLLDQYNAMPMEYQRFIDSDVFMETMTAFHSGTVTAEQAASELQNKISILLMEFG